MVAFLFFKLIIFPRTLRLTLQYPTVGGRFVYPVVDVAVDYANRVGHPMLENVSRDRQMSLSAEVTCGEVER
jgi:hypothetical protein